MIKHYPLFDTDEIAEIYSKRDGVEVKYVCTSDLHASDHPVDVFYRSTPHPTFGNKYFGIYVDGNTGSSMITNADSIEQYDFGLCKNDYGELEYSQSHHDYKSFENGNSIDGGRQYMRGWGYESYKIKDGQFVKN